MTTQNIALSFQSVVKKFGDQRAVSDVSLDIRDGEWVTLLGPSGSGKTTLLKILAGFEQLTSGAVLLRGKDVSRLTPAERGIGMVFQQYALFPHMTVAENIAYGLKMHGWNKPDRVARVKEMLSLVQLDAFGGRMPAQLSGGQQQRVALARALAFGPTVLLMDEPLGALDRSLRLEMEQQFRKIHRELRPTVIYVTHDQEEALVLSDRIAILRDGRLLAFDTPRNLHDNPGSALVASFFAGADLLPVEKATVVDNGTEITCAGESLRVPEVWSGDALPLIAVGPSRWKQGNVAGAWGAEASVTDLSYLGDTTQLTCEIEWSGTRSITVRTDAEESLNVAVGDRIPLSLAPRDVRLVSDDRGQ